MITNSSLTVYHKGFNENTQLETWTRFNYKNVWAFESQNANINEGYNRTNNIEVRIPYSKNSLDINNFAIGDIIVKGELNLNIEAQKDLSDYQVYNITSIKNNNFGNSQHIHIGGK